MTHPRSKYNYNSCPQCKGKKSKTAKVCKDCYTPLSKGLSYRVNPSLTTKFRCIDCNSFLMPEKNILQYHNGHKIEPMSSISKPNKREKRLMKALGISSKLSLYMKPREHGATYNSKRDDGSKLPKGREPTLNEKYDESKVRCGNCFKTSEFCTCGRNTGAYGNAKTRWSHIRGEEQKTRLKNGTWFGYTKKHRLKEDK